MLTAVYDGANNETQLSYTDNFATCLSRKFNLATENRFLPPKSESFPSAKSTILLIQRGASFSRSIRAIIDRHGSP